MKKAWFVCLLLVIGTLWAIDATYLRRNKEFRFLDGAQSVFSADVVIRPHSPTHVETYNLHMPFDEAWSLAEVELIDHRGWKLGDHSVDTQDFNLPHRTVVSLIRGKVDNRQDFIPGTEATDTCVEIRTRM